MSLTSNRNLCTIFEKRVRHSAHTMKKIVTDSTSLILLSKCGLLETTCKIYEVIAPSSVINETASENLAGIYPDAAGIRDLILKGAIKVEDPEPVSMNLSLTLHRGEEDALLLTADFCQHPTIHDRTDQAVVEVGTRGTLARGILVRCNQGVLEQHRRCSDVQQADL